METTVGAADQNLNLYAPWAPGPITTEQLLSYTQASTLFSPDQVRCGVRIFGGSLSSMIRPHVQEASHLHYGPAEDHGTTSRIYSPFSQAYLGVYHQAFDAAPNEVYSSSGPSATISEPGIQKNRPFILLERISWASI